MNSIRLAKFLPGSRANGPGLRDVFWTAGCSIHCPGCINPHLLDARNGVDVPLAEIEEVIDSRRDVIEGISFSGGEPTDQPAAVAHLARFARSRGLSVVVFTGRTLEECMMHRERRELIAACDLVVAGPYDRNAEQRTAPLLGSANQRIHFVTERYGPQDLAEVPNAEIVTNGTRIVLSGL